jgi:hypothetical protein
MSLKAFHVIFISAASALCFGFAVWALKNFFAPDGRGLDLVFGISSSLIGIALLVYERYFLKKFKNVSYL